MISKTTLLNLILEYPNIFLLNIGIFVGIIFDLIFFQTIYINHVGFSGCIIYILAIAYGLIIQHQSIDSKMMCGCCDNCKAFIYVGQDCFELDLPDKKALSLQYCNETCLELSAKDYPIIQSLNFKKKIQMEDDIPSIYTILKIKYFILVVSFYNGDKYTHACGLLEYILMLANKEKLTMYEKFILYNCQVCDIIS